MLGPPPPDATCPYLGLFDDPRSHFTFPTEAHRCFAPGRPIQVEPEYQDGYCLSTRYPECKRFRSAEAAARRRSGAPAAVATATPVATAPVATATPAPPRANATPRANRASWVWGLLRLLAALILLALVVAMGMGAFGKTPPDGGASDGASPSLAATASATPVASVSTTLSPALTDAPAPTPIVHVVAPGESLSSIALIYGVTVEAIQAANNIDNPSLIRTGQRLIIPTPP